MSVVMNVMGVLLGLAEVKIPLKNLSPNDRLEMTYICYRKLLELENDSEMTKETNLRCIGVVDSFYAFQEVAIRVESDAVELRRNEAAILRFDPKQVVTVVAVKETQARLAILCLTENFGRTILVLQMKHAADSDDLLSVLSPNEVKTSVKRSRSQLEKVRSGAESMNKFALKKISDLLTTAENRFRNVSSSVSLGSGGSEQRDPLQIQNLSDDDSDESEFEIDSEDGDEPDANSNLTTSTDLDSTKIRCNDNVFKTPQVAEMEFLIKSEHSYVYSLQNLNNFKITHCEDNHVPMENVQTLTMHVTELFSLHSKLLQNLESCEMKITNFVSIFFELSKDFGVYVDFIRNISITEKIIDKFKDIFISMNNVLIEDIRKPRMRLNNYILTFESLKKYSNEDERRSINDVIEVLRKYLKEADTRLITDTINLCPFCLFDYGYLVLNSKLSLKKGHGLAKRIYNVLLMDNLLVLAKGKKDCNEYVSSFHLNDVELVHEMRGVLIHLKIRYNKIPVLILKAKTVNMQQKWIVNIKNYIRNSLLRNKSLSDSTNEVFAVRKSENNLKIMVPLNVLITHRNLTRSLFLKETNINVYLNEVQESEKLLLRNTEYILNKNAQTEFETYLGCIKNMYEFHIRYFYPALSLKNDDQFAERICSDINRKCANFIEFANEILYWSNVMFYENENIHLHPLLIVAVDNFFLYKQYLEQQRITAKSMTVLDIFDMSIKEANWKLKQKYTPDLVHEGNEILLEGFLHIKEYIGNISEEMYVILTTIHVHLLNMLESNVHIHKTLKNSEIKLGSPSGFLSIQLKYKHFNKTNLITFTARDIQTKTIWLQNFTNVIIENSTNQKVSNADKSLGSRTIGGSEDKRNDALYYESAL